jgi:hypothetical protein
MVQSVRPKDHVMDQVFPYVDVANKDGKFYVWTQADWFRNEAEAIAPGDQAPRGGPNVSTDTYSCQTYKFASVLPDEIRDNADSVLKLRQTKSLYCSNKLSLAREIRVATLLVTAASWSDASTNNPATQWNAANSTPIDDIYTAIAAFKAFTGYYPNRIVTGWDIVRWLMVHSQIQGVMATTALQIPSTQTLAQIFGVEKWLVCNATYNTALKGQTASYSDVMSDDLWMGYVTSSPSIDVPSAGYQFRFKKEQIRTWREESPEQEVVEAKHSVSEEVTTALLGYVLKDCIA